jgi:hypothetical protein
MLWPLLAVRQGILNSLNGLTADRMEKPPKASYAVATVFALLMTSLAMARVYIVVEAFLSLRSMPATVYETPNWPQWFPHL